MGIAVTYNSEIRPMSRKGPTDSFQGEHNGHRVAIKVVRAYTMNGIKVAANVIAQLCLYSEGVSLCRSS